MSVQIVLNFHDGYDVSTTLTHLRDGCSYGCSVIRSLAYQIEEQSKPPRIPEPGLWGVVEAGHKHLEDGRRSKFVRVATEGRFQWVEREAEADWCIWADLIDPVRVRPGIEDES